MWKVWLTQRLPPQMTVPPSKPAPPLSKGFQLPPARGSSAAVSTVPFQAVQTVSMKGEDAVEEPWSLVLDGKFAFMLLLFGLLCQYLSTGNNVCDRVLNL